MNKPEIHMNGSDQASEPVWTQGRMAFQLTEGYEQYVLSHSSAYTENGARLLEATEALGEPAVMMLAKEQYALIGFLTGILGCTRALDIGTFTGVSALAFAEAVGPHGSVVTVDRSDEWTALAERHWRMAGVDDRIEVRRGEAQEVLEQLATEERQFDIVFVDADKVRTQAYFDEIVVLLDVGGLIMIDNSLWHGWVLDEQRTDPDTVGMRDFNESLISDMRVESVVLPIGDGMTLIRLRDSMTGGAP